MFRRSLRNSDNIKAALMLTLLLLFPLNKTSCLILFMVCFFFFQWICIDILKQTLYISFEPHGCTYYLLMSLLIQFDFICFVCTVLLWGVMCLLFLCFISDKVAP